MNYQLEELRNHIGDILCSLGAQNSQIFVLDSDLAKSTTTNVFSAHYPERFVECGIAEQSAMSIATGLAIEGKIPFYVNFAIFVTGTAWTQLRQACYANANIKIIGTHPGMDDGPDGASHHANEDIALAKVLPNLKILIPRTKAELAACITLAAETQGPVYIRVARDAVPVLECKPYAPSFGGGELVMEQGSDLALIFEGTAALLAYQAYEALSKAGTQCKLVNLSSVKPLDNNLLKRIASEVQGIITIENHSVIGGIGSSIADFLVQKRLSIPLEKIGVEDVYTESGKSADIKSKYGLNVENVLKKAARILPL